jgi:DNA repair protein RadC
MEYRQVETGEQLTLFTKDSSAKTKQVGVPIYKIALIREGELPTYNSRIRSSATASAVLKEYLADTDREHFVVMLLDTKNGVIGLNTVSIGSLNASVVHPGSSTFNRGMVRLH